MISQMDNQYEQVRFQGIELQGMDSIRSKEPSLTKKLIEYEVPTRFGFSVHVYVQEGNRQPLLTFHDIGTNHTSFLGFFNYPEMRVLMTNFTVYHICAPGHHDNSPTLAEEEERNALLSAPSTPTGSGWSLWNMWGKGDTSRIKGTFPTMDELALVVEDVVKHFNLKNFLGFGVGAGSNVLSRYALRNADNIHALFLINPTSQVAGYYEWFRAGWNDVPQLKRGMVTDNMMYILENHWFGYHQAEHPDVVEMYQQTMRSLNLSNLAGYIESFLNRPDLGLVRQLDYLSASYDPKTVIRCDTCLVAGDRAVEIVRTMTDMNGQMDPTKTQFLIVPDCTGMLMEENPQKLANDFLMYLRNVGIMVTMTPEKLTTQAIELQKEAMMLRNSEQRRQILALPDHVC